MFDACDKALRMSSRKGCSPKDGYVEHMLETLSLLSLASGMRASRSQGEKLVSNDACRHAGTFSLYHGLVEIAAHDG